MLMPLLKTICRMAVLVMLLLAIAPAVHAQDITGFVLDEVVFKDINGETGHTYERAGDKLTWQISNGVFQYTASRVDGPSGSGTFTVQPPPSGVTARDLGSAIVFTPPATF